jgi:hypothetical protein
VAHQNRAKERGAIPSPVDECWLDLDRAASVDVTSEENEYPVEFALVSGETQGWRAANTGTQTIRLLFDHPQRLSRIGYRMFCGLSS